MIIEYLKSLLKEYAKIKFSTFSESIKKLGIALLIATIFLIIFTPIDIGLWWSIRYFLIK